MSIQIDTLKGINPIDLSHFSLDKEKEQMRDQIEMLEREVDRLNVIVDALAKAIKIIDRG